VGAVAKVQVRLNQAVIGCMYPRTINDKNSEKTNRLNEIFVKNYKSRAIPEVVNAIMNLLN